MRTLLYVLAGLATQAEPNWKWQQGKLSVHRIVDSEMGVVCYLATDQGSSVVVPSLHCLPYGPAVLK